MKRFLIIAIAWLTLTGSSLAAIVSSVIIEDAAQKDGRRWITERHTDQLGKTYDVVYIAIEGANVNTALAARATQINQQLIDRETAANVQRAIDSAAAPILNYSAASDFRSALRERYKSATGWDAIRLGSFINGLGLSDGQLTAIFGVSGAQLTSLKTKLSNQASKYAAAISEAGQ